MYCDTINSVIPNFIEFESTNRVISIAFNDESTLKILRRLDVNKDHSHDDILIRMIKLCDKSIIPAIPLIYKSYISGTQELSLIDGGNRILSQFTKKVISKSLTIADQFHFYQLFVKLWKGFFFFFKKYLFYFFEKYIQKNQ